MRILILEDDGHRALIFVEKFYAHELTIIENSNDAIDLLDQGVYDYLFLDHDLGEGNGSGSDVSAFLRSHPENLNNQARIIIHSWNIPAAMRMVDDLPGAHWAPFNTEQFFEIVIK